MWPTSRYLRYNTALQWFEVGPALNLFSTIITQNQCILTNSANLNIDVSRESHENLTEFN
jgi:hypothetical protein